nr:MAG TPA: hypothetical protein [Bacteriophage sp.]
MDYKDLVSSLSELDLELNEKLFRVRNSSHPELEEMGRSLFNLDEYSDTFFSAAGGTLYLSYTHRDDEGIEIITLALPEWFVNDFDNHMKSLNQR